MQIAELNRALLTLPQVLYKARVHPEQPANSLDREAFERVWRHSVLLLQRGFLTGSILTVDQVDADRLGKPWTRRCAKLARPVLCRAFTLCCRCCCCCCS